MRLRNAAAAAAAALSLVLTLPTSASAAQGEFTYRFIGLDGAPQTGRLLDPESRECINLPEVADPDSSEPADSPRNRTDATATVFKDPDCEGDYFTLRPLTGHGSERLKIRSVVFS
ncbi:hypothetical protein [Saccharothrix sp. ST-888]|uniref:hypothetical protein n=1 Tax=Saccharothrix sp. ST-888 TaxID=1427391 RepID=UPI0005ECFE35|nr:hypothetical protein [Saccharothrix sp. ST-888]KJK59180.1 hypothetical protein UK12_05675 [Saccharothrix sp. ST-888]